MAADAPLGAATRDKLREFPADPHALRPAFCMQGTAVLIGATVWDVKTGKKRLALFDENQRPHGIAISPNGRNIIGSTDEGQIRVMELSSAKELVSVRGQQLVEEAAGRHSASEGSIANPVRVLAVGFTTQGAPLALLRNERNDQVTVWNVQSARKLCQLEAEYCYSGRISADGEYVVLIWDDVSDSIESAAVYETSTGRKVAAWSSSVVDWNRVAPYVFTPDNRHILVRAPAEQITMIELRTGEPVRRFGGHEQSIRSFRLIDQRRTLETRSTDSAYRWNVESGELLASFKAPAVSDRNERNAAKAGVAPAPNGKNMLVGDQLFDADSQEHLASLRPLMSAHETMNPNAGSMVVTHAEFLPNGKTALLVWQDNYGWNQGAMFDVASGKLVRHIALRPKQQHFNLKWSPDGNRALTLVDGLHRFWDVENGRPLQTIGRVAKNALYASPNIAFSPNGEYLYVFGRQFGVFLWDSKTGAAHQHEPPGQDLPSKRALLDGRKHGYYYRGRSAVTSDGRLAASSYQQKNERDHRILVWNLDQGEVAHTLDHSPYLPVAPFFSPDGRYLAVVCSRSDKKVFVWDVQTGARMYDLDLPEMAQPSDFPVVHFPPNGETLLVNSGVKTLALYQIQSGECIHTMTDSPSEPQRRDDHLRESMLLSPNGRFLLADYSSRYARVWDLVKGEAVLRIDRAMGHIDAETYFQFSEDGQRLLTRYRPATIWDLASSEVTSVEERVAIRDIPGFRKRTTSIEGDRGTRRDVPAELLERWKARIPGNSLGIEMTVDGRRLIVYEPDASILVLDANSGEIVRRCFLFHNGSRWLTVAADGSCHGSLQYVRYREQSTGRE